MHTNVKVKLNGGKVLVCQLNHGSLQKKETRARIGPNLLVLHELSLLFCNFINPAAM